MWAKSKRWESASAALYLCFWALRWRFNLRRFALCALIAILLSLTISPSYAQTSPASATISKQDWMASNVDLAIVKAQLAEYRKALQIATAERDNLREQLAQHSTDSARQSQEQAQELGKLTQRLADLNSTISALESSSDSAAKMYQGLLDKADKDHRAEVSALERSRDFWRVAAIVSAAAAVGLGVYAAVK